MRAGRLNTRITIQRRTDTRTAAGQRVASWGDWKTVWAQKKVTAGKAAEEFDAKQHQSTVKFFIRKVAGITAEMRVVHQGHVYELAGPPVDWEDGRGLTLLTIERV